jgi:hypothetical protein
MSMRRPVGAMSPNGPVCVACTRRRTSTFSPSATKSSSGSAMSGKAGISASCSWATPCGPRTSNGRPGSCRTKSGAMWRAIQPVSRARKAWK